MKRLSVISSKIASIGHDAEAKVLEVEFLNESVYRYRGVPESVYISLLRADSQSKYIKSYIKGRYRQEKVG